MRFAQRLLLRLLSGLLLWRTSCSGLLRSFFLSCHFHWLLSVSASSIEKWLARSALRSGWPPCDRANVCRIDNKFESSDRVDVAIKTTQLTRTFQIGTGFARIRQDEFGFRHLSRHDSDAGNRRCSSLESIEYGPPTLVLLRSIPPRNLPCNFTDFQR
jgi:hypothetical protein